MRLPSLSPLLLVCLLAAACGGGDDADGGSAGDGDTGGKDGGAGSATLANGEETRFRPKAISAGAMVPGYPVSGTKQRFTARIGYDPAEGVIAVGYDAANTTEEAYDVTYAVRFLDAKGDLVGEDEATFPSPDPGMQLSSPGLLEVEAGVQDVAAITRIVLTVEESPR